MRPLHVLAVQADLRWENPEANHDHIESLLEAVSARTDLVILPEMFPTGFTMNAAANAQTMEGPSVKWMQMMAEKFDALVLGSLIIEEEGNYFNRALIINKNGVYAQYDKRHLFRMAGEDESYTGGEDMVIFTHRGWRICPMICYDLRFPVWSRNRLSDENKGYDLLIYMANWPETRISHWEKLLQARAIENQSFVIGVNRVGTDGNDVHYNGYSSIVDAYGEIIRQDRGSVAVIEAELKLDRMLSYREKFPFWLDSDKYSVK